MHTLLAKSSTEGIDTYEDFSKFDLNFYFEPVVIDSSPFFAGTTDYVRSLALIYDEEEKDILKQRFSGSTPELQIDLQVPPLFDYQVVQRSVKIEPISYDSISSLGEISQELITISATTGSVTGLITEQTQVITDVGGLSTAGRDRTITNTGVSTQIQSEIAIGDGGTVTTSGY